MAAPNAAAVASTTANYVENQRNYVENRRKFSDAIAAVGPNPNDEIVARGTEILANALVTPKTYNQFLAARMAVAYPERHRMYAAAVAYIADNPGTDIPDDSLGGIKLAEVVACMTKAAVPAVKVEGYYLHFAKKLFQPLEDAKRFFEVEKDEIRERLQKEKAALNPATASTAAVAPNPCTASRSIFAATAATTTAAPNPDSVSRRKLAVAAAAAAATTAVAAAAAEAAFVNNLYFLNPEKLAAVATAAQAAFVKKIECYYLELAKKLFEPLEDAKRAFAMEKDEIIERFQKEKDEITERLQKEKRLLKEKDEVIESLHKKKDEVTERLHKRRKRSLRA